MESLDEGHGFEWAKVGTTTAGGRLGDRHMPGGRRPLGPANVGVTEDRIQNVWRIKEDLIKFGDGILEYWINNVQRNTK